MGNLLKSNIQGPVLEVHLCLSRFLIQVSLKGGQLVKENWEAVHTTKGLQIFTYRALSPDAFVQSSLRGFVHGSWAPLAWPSCRQEGRRVAAGQETHEKRVQKCFLWLPGANSCLSPSVLQYSDKAHWVYSGMQTAEPAIFSCTERVMDSSRSCTPMKLSI